jgi:radical SAM protein with 4Fe4S-binding SPASM domain
MITKKTSLSHVILNILFKKNEPVSVVHFLTNRCNARCSFCFIDFENKDTFKGELNLQEIEKFTKTLGKSLLNINLTGGEPFARKDIIQIAKLYLDNTPVQSIYITTNGSLPDRVENFAKEIILYRNDIELTFQISIDDFPENHDKVRKIDGLFQKCIDTYNRLKNLKNVSPVISITVTHENCDNIKNIFYYLHNNLKIESIKCTIVRDEGVFTTPIEKKKKILDAYDWITSQIEKMSKNKELSNYNSSSLQGRLHRKKDFISWKIIKETYLRPKYISQCYAGSLFGIIKANGDVFPCEILEDKKIGNLKDYNFDFMKLWNSKKNGETKNFIKKTNCNCTYECALTYNILGNYRYHFSLLKSAFNLD